MNYTNNVIYNITNMPWTMIQKLGVNIEMSIYYKNLFDLWKSFDWLTLLVFHYALSLNVHRMDSLY